MVLALACIVVHTYLPLKESTERDNGYFNEKLKNSYTKIAKQNNVKYKIGKAVFYFFLYKKRHGFNSRYYCNFFFSGARLKSFVTLRKSFLSLQNRGF